MKLTDTTVHSVHMRATTDAPPADTFYDTFPNMVVTQYFYKLPD